jgi:prepilin-type N-terminal cleavage/methylation domain-containing protein
MLRKSSASGKNSVALGDKGFSLLELVVAMAVFLLISGAALSLFRQQQLASQGLTGQVGLNLSLRNAVSQLQMDLANAGSGYYQSQNMPSWPVGVTLVNNVVPQGNSCYTAGTFTYGANCFDQLNIITGANAATNPPVQPTDSTGVAAPPLAHCSDTSTGVAYGQAAPGLTLAATAALYNRGDQLLFLSSNGTQITSVVLTQPPVVAGGAVKFNFNATDVHGLNTRDHDPLDITTCHGNRPCSLCYDPADGANCTNTVNFSRTTKQFCASDWILKVNAIIYKVNSTDRANPLLTRQVGINGNPETVMEQVIGFKAGASIWNGANTFADQGQYVYDASTYTNDPNNLGNANMAYNFTLVRSVRISLIGRTVPDFRGTYTYRNGFDNGPYQVQGVAVVVNPRNLSMND